MNQSLHQLYSEITIKHSYLPSQIVMIQMSHIQGLSGESIRLHFHISSCHLKQQPYCLKIYNPAVTMSNV